MWSLVAEKNDNYYEKKCAENAVKIFICSICRNMHTLLLGVRLSLADSESDAAAGGPSLSPGHGPDQDTGPGIIESPSQSPTHRDESESAGVTSNSDAGHHRVMTHDSELRVGRSSLRCRRGLGCHSSYRDRLSSRGDRDRDSTRCR
jgi:hypothetical protein